MQGNPTPPPQCEMDKVLVGVCHHLNNRLAAINGYVFLLRKRDRLGEYDAPLQEQLDQLERTIRMLRSLLRDTPPAQMPVSLAALVETATEVMEDYPDGPVRFSMAPGQEPGVVRADWVQLLRAVLETGAWVTRDDHAVRDVTLTVAAAEGDIALILDGAGNGANDPGISTLPPPSRTAAWSVEYVGQRTARITVTATNGLPSEGHPS